MIEFDAMSRAELIELRAEIDKTIAAVSQRDKSNALEAAEAAARQHGYSLTDLAALVSSGKRPRGPAKNSAAGGTQAVRFRNPEDHSQTWSGRGRRPRWHHEAEAAGRPIEELR